MVPVIPLVHLDPPWTAISGVWLHEVVQAGSRWSRGGPGAPTGPWCWVVDQERPGPPWSTKKLFPDVWGVVLARKFDQYEPLACLMALKYPVLDSLARWR